MSSRHSCPFCHSDEHLSSSYTLRIAVRDWPALCSCACLIIVAGQILKIGIVESFWFAGLAVLPFLTQLARKYSCLRCRIDYYAIQNDRAAIEHGEEW